MTNRAEVELALDLIGTGTSALAYMALRLREQAEGEWTPTPENLRELAGALERASERLNRVSVTLNAAFRGVPAPAVEPPRPTLRLATRDGEPI